MEEALGAAVAALPPRDRLRLGCYYAEGLTLAQTGRLLNEHEATVSRHLTRTRKAIRTAVESRLRGQTGFSNAEITQCFADVAEDPGSLDLERLLEDARKEPVQDRLRTRDSCEPVTQSGRRCRSVAAPSAGFGGEAVGDRCLHRS